MIRLSLFVRYWIVLATIVTLPIVVAAIVVGRSVYRTGFAEVMARQTLEARQAALLVERELLPITQRLRLVARIPWNAPAATPAEFAAEIRRVIRQYPLVERVQRFGSDGGIVGYFSQDGSPKPWAESDLRQLRELDAGVLRAGTPVLVRRGDRAGWAFALAESGTSNLQVAEFAADVLRDVLATLQSDRTMVFIVDRAGTIVGHPDFVTGAVQLTALTGWGSVAGLGEAISSRTAGEGSLGAIEATVSNDPTLGNRWLAAYRSIDAVGWTVFALRSATDLEAELRSAVMRTALVLLAANLFVLLAALVAARRFSRPITALAEASQRVAQGDLSARADVLGDDDIGRLSVQFNAMVGELEASYGELEARVAEKTAALEQANRHKSEFLAQMSHELRTPLNAIISFSDALTARYFGPLTDKQLEYVSDIHASGVHLLSLINDLLDIAKIEAGRMELALDTVELGDLVEGSLALVRERARLKGVQLRATIGPGAESCFADGRRVKQVLVNLLSNAVKFAPEAGNVELGVRRVEGENAVEFVVSDDGPGIAPDDLDRLFTDFMQGQAAGNGQREGTGLGLALSQRIALLHGSTIDVASELGHGARFSFRLAAAA